MSNTGQSKRLASFNCSVELWEEFIRQCRDSGTTATAVLTLFISHYVDNSLDELPISLGKITASQKRDWSQQVKELVEQYLELHLPSYLDKYIVNQLSEQKEQQLNTPEQENWLVRERAKYLGKKITAEQLIHIELSANDIFKQRHGTIPKRQLVRGHQFFVYPNNDVDILDAVIFKLTAD
jgi:hypothetical protein